MSPITIKWYTHGVFTIAFFVFLLWIVLRFKVCDFQNDCLDVLCKTSIMPKKLTSSNIWFDVDKTWYIGTYGSPEWFYTTLISAKYIIWPPWCHNYCFSKNMYLDLHDIWSYLWTNTFKRNSFVINRGEGYSSQPLGDSSC